MTNFFPPEPASWLDLDDYRARFKEEWESADQRFLKVERRQEYREPDDPSFQAFERGDYEDARRLVADRIREQESFYASARARGVELVRVRVAELPLSDYLAKYEMYSYGISEEIGERVHIALADDHQELLGRYNVPDFLLFDRNVVLVNSYDDAGIAQGAWVVENRALVQVYEEVASGLLKDSVRVTAFLAAQAAQAAQA